MFQLKFSSVFKFRQSFWKFWGRLEWERLTCDEYLDQLKKKKKKQLSYKDHTRFERAR